MNTYLLTIIKVALLVGFIALILSSCSKEKQRKTYEFEGILYSYYSGLPETTERNVSGKLIMDTDGYGEISFDGVPAVKVKAVSKPKDKYYNFLSEEDNGLSGGCISENGDVSYSTQIDYFLGKLK